MDNVWSQLQLWAHMLLEVNPNIIAISMAVVLVPLIIVIGDIGKNPPASKPVHTGKIVTVDTKGRVRERKVEQKKDN